MYYRHTFLHDTHVFIFVFSFLLHHVNNFIARVSCMIVHVLYRTELSFFVYCCTSTSTWCIYIALSCPSLFIAVPLRLHGVFVSHWVVFLCLLLYFYVYMVYLYRTELSFFVYCCTSTSICVFVSHWVVFLCLLLYFYVYIVYLNRTELSEQVYIM